MNALAAEPKTLEEIRWETEDQLWEELCAVVKADGSVLVVRKRPYRSVMQTSDPMCFCARYSPDGVGGWTASVDMEYAHDADALRWLGR